MSGREKKAGEPLLYINQPNIKKPVIDMQSTYQSPQQPMKETKHEVDKKLDKTKQEQEQVKMKPEPLQEQIKEKAEEKEQSIFGMRRVKGFREMNIPEKLQYLSRFSSDQPLYYCDFLMHSEEIYRGAVYQLESDEVIIQTMNNEKIKKKVADIRFIRIVQK